MVFGLACTVSHYFHNYFVTTHTNDSQLVYMSHLVALKLTYSCAVKFTLNCQHYAILTKQLFCLLSWSGLSGNLTRTSFDYSWEPLWLDAVLKNKLVPVRLACEWHLRNLECMITINFQQTTVDRCWFDFNWPKLDDSNLTRFNQVQPSKYLVQCVYPA